ncbi:TonB-dependent receptor domain-containing protein [Chondrinema litorale]|uniref:TonB-dependent receptor domain-containing protein n=1 Tax=Chondrinema litorale TaxID=2994555 RepID=UPI002542E892|nr:TonB-dependent receptor [Chondrinema litorale]UZR97369.1 TonB-dependent receptor [Chondrinema litorale]
MKAQIISAILIIILAPCLIYNLSAQDLPNLDIEGAIYGEIRDKESNQPMEYATVALYSLMKNEAVKGTLTDAKGQFALKDLSLGIYNLEISFIGYKKTRINQILILPKKPEIYFGEIQLEPDTEQLEEVVITEQREDVVFKADRKVINISNIITAQGGTLVEALENQPSVKTDMNGNMTLRGSSNFTVLVNGKPTALRGSDALQQIPANTVESVEIITNPSAKFDSEGEVGIINVITKKDFSEGFSGVVNASGGFTANWLTRYSSDASFQLTRNKITFSTGFNIQYTPMEGEGSRIRENYGESDTLIRNSDMDIGIYRKNYTFKTGLTFNVDTRNTFTWDLNIGKLKFEREFDSQTTALTNTSQNTISNSIAENDRNFISSSFGYDHLFDLSSGHKFSANLFYKVSDGNKEDVLIEEVANTDWTTGDLIVDQLSLEDGTEDELRLNLDYVKPFGEGNNRLELGYQLRYETNDLDQNIAVTSVDENTSTDNNIQLTRNIHAWYLQFTGEKESFAYQIGLRPEITDREIDQAATSNTESYFNIFPSANISYNFSQFNQIKLGYSKRINRPAVQQLNPYLQLIDEKSQRSGNVELLPEYVHSLELSVIKRFMMSFLSAEIFYRQTNDKISPVWLAQENDLLLLSYDNLDKDYSYGTEILASMQINDWWRVNGSTSIYRYNINGDVSGEEVNNSSNSWNARFGSTFRISKTNTVIQFNVIYNSELASSQGQRKGFYATMLGVKQPLFKSKLDAALQVRDVFNMIKFSNVSSSEYFLNSMEFLPYTPVVSLNLSYRFNNYKKRRNINASDINELDFQNDFNF